LHRIGYTFLVKLIGWLLLIAAAAGVAVAFWRWRRREEERRRAAKERLRSFMAQAMPTRAAVEERKKKLARP